MKIKNIAGLSAADLQQEVSEGGKFIYYSYTISILLVTFRRTSGVYLLRASENAVYKGFQFTFLSMLFGWWAIPYGPKFTLESLRTNLRGGKNVTNEVMDTVEGYLLFKETQQQK